MGKGLAALLCAVAAVSAAPASAKKTTENYTSVTVFGDSLVDAGNFLIDSGGTRPNPALGYFPGRWTNGYDYTDLISLSLFGTPTLASQAGGSNYAYGGARSLNTSVFPPHLDEQFGRYTARVTAGTASNDPNGLYVLNFGANDLFNVAATANDPAFGYNGDQQAVIRDAAINYAQLVKDLNDAGVRNILITTFPLASALSTYGTEQLNLALDNLALDADTTVFRFDYVAAFTKIQTNPGLYGIAPFTQTGSCLSGGAAAVANGCVGYFTFDGTHPVAAVHRALYAEMNSQFALTNDVPEPATWGLMILGFAVVGAAARRTRVRYRLA